ncbi:hypothetical protein [uncultured Nostoc sp.]|uniref:hypothetical protein n=1 Tax=uncultured Nostoc sp. TaxID=340711 RepID=UPI0026083A48|nr:hypothetical protein [uncultured Nostoc sp.]
MEEEYPVYLRLSAQKLSQLGFDAYDKDFEESEIRRVPSPFNQRLENAPKVGEIWINRKWETSNQIIAVALNIYFAEWDIIFRELMEDGSQKSTTSSCFLQMFLELYKKSPDTHLPN